MDGEPPSVRPGPRGGGHGTDGGDTTTIPNIGPRERARRARLGWTLLATGVVSGAVLVGGDVTRGWRLLSFLPLWGGALGVFQARGKT
ncbi:MAG TPA: hypothetical protein VE173_15410 [Longimicrobiales bacterium]|jgi:hypothetical protein|nr:hypothetical protein [Longimicrobiales bacterium]